MDPNQSPRQYLAPDSCNITSPTASSGLLRVLGYITLAYPRLIAWPVGAIGVPVTYLVYLWQWLGFYQRRYGRDVVQVREVVKVVESGGSKMRRLNGMEKEIHVRREGEVLLHRDDQLHSPGLLALLGGTPSSDRWTNVASLLVNTVITLAVIDSMWTLRLAFGCEDVRFARTTSLGPHFSSLSFRSPSPTLQPYTARVAYRPLLAPELLSMSSPSAWELSERTMLSQQDDWNGRFTIDGLSADTQYEYRLQSDGGELFPTEDLSSFNFTTFPDPRLARASGSHFRFVHAGSPRYYPLRYEPLSALPSLIPSRTPFTSFSPAHLLHSIRSHRLRQPSWGTLSTWLADMRDRSAWAQVQFALLGEDPELYGRGNRPMGVSSQKQRRESRQLLASRDFRDVFGTLPILPSTLHSEGSKLEPGALSVPEASFSYGNAFFFRLRRPMVEHGEKDSQDWQLGVDEMVTWLATVNGTDSLKFVLSPITLSPFFGGSHVETMWRQAVLDVLGFVPNVVVLAESAYGFSASILRRTVVEFASPTLDQPPASPFPLWPKSMVIPDITVARTETSSHWAKQQGEIAEASTTERVDRLLNFVPNSAGAKWTSIEVDTTHAQPRAIAVLFDGGQPFWRLEFVGSSSTRSNMAVGGIAESFQHLLRKLGLSSFRW